MKTTNEVFKMYFGSAKEYSDHGAYLIKEAMKAYAKEAIDRCAEKCYKRNIVTAGVPEIKTIIDQSEILKVKLELK